MTSAYGTKAWKLMAAYRTFHYVPGPQRFPNQYLSVLPLGLCADQRPADRQPAPDRQRFKHADCRCTREITNV